MEAILSAHADLAWMLAAFTFVMLMIPGLALYYGGMVGGRNILNMMSMVLITLGITCVVYVVYGYGMVSGPTAWDAGVVGNPADFIGLGDWMADDGSGGTQTLYFAAWFILFAAITIAIVASGAAGRMKFSAWLLFVPVWLTLVYFPVAHWVFAVDADGYQGGFLVNDIGIHDYAGGTAVHMNSGVAALALALALGARRRRAERPNNVPLALLGGGILWFGWFGFNGSCAGGANFTTQVVILNTLLAGGAGILGFAALERYREGHVTSLGIMTGAIAGLVGITPSADTMTPLGALGVGIAAGAVVALVLSFKARMKVDDTLDAFAVHGIGGIVGTLCIVLWASDSAPAGVQGVLLGGDAEVVWKELAGILITCAYSFVLTYLIAKAIDKTIGLRVDTETEVAGLDPTVHAESAYEIPASGLGGGPGGAAPQIAHARHALAGDGTTTSSP
ncbi:ammonium transporter [Gordonia sp. VNK21]|uniref:ammonium transporter n=1 Tax=Gordonia sp. VNK21 TaxID=3382483 RepID=UPI0038D3A29A